MTYYIKYTESYSDIYKVCFQVYFSSLTGKFHLIFFIKMALYKETAFSSMYNNIPD